jgi:hypothetical protein
LEKTDAYRKLSLKERQGRYSNLLFFIRAYVFSYEALYASLHSLIRDYPWSDLSKNSIPLTAKSPENLLQTYDRKPMMSIKNTEY